MKIRLFALGLAVVLFALAAASCGSPKVSVNCTVSVMIDGEYILDHYSYTVQGTEEKRPTVLQATREALQMIGISSQADAENLSMECITYDGVDYKSGMDPSGDKINFWIYTLDGVEPKEGRAGTNYVQEGQQIVFTYETQLINEPTFNE